MSLVLKTIFILLIGLAIRLHPEYVIMSSVAWGSAIYALAYLDEDKPWKHAYHKWGADSCLVSYAVLIYLVVFHVVVINGWAGF